MFQLPPSWSDELREEVNKPYMHQLAQFLEAEYRGSTPIYPPQPLIFNAFIQTPVPLVKVVIVGQDPYHGKHQAHGLSFSVPKGVPLPPSLQNIFKELKSDLGVPTPSHGCLLSWAKQGVLLLNATLTVREGNPKSHYGHGWERFTDAVIDHLSKKNEPIVFLLWGKSAQEKCGHFLNRPNGHHCVLTAPHPSPYSVNTGFFGCRHFSKANQFLVEQGRAPIDWAI